MKKLVVLALAAASIVPVQAQKWNFGVEAGYVHNTLAVEEFTATARSGFKAGAIAEFTLDKNVAFEAGLAFIRKCATISLADIGYGYASIYSIKFAEMNYLQIPLMVGYNFNLGKNFSIKPEVGGYYAVGVSGHALVSGTTTLGFPYEGRVETFSGSDIVSPETPPYRPSHRNDGGLAFALNVNYRHFGVKAEYDLGLATTTFNGNGKQRTLSVSLVYRIF